MTSDLLVRSGRGPDWDPWSDCASPPRRSLPSQPSPATAGRNPSQPHQARGWTASRRHSSSPPCWAVDGQLATPRRSCEENIWSEASKRPASLLLSHCGARKLSQADVLFCDENIKIHMQCRGERACQSLAPRQFRLKKGKTQTKHHRSPVWC